mgnify:CR=1 FL=1
MPLQGDGRGSDSKVTTLWLRKPGNWVSISDTKFINANDVAVDTSYANGVEIITPPDFLEAVQVKTGADGSFTLTQVPAGLAGFVITGLLAAALSTLDSSINASAATVTNDFYRRFRSSQRDEKHYLYVGRVMSVVFSAIMIGVALIIHAMRTETLMDVQTVVYPVVTAGLLSLFLLGFMTVRVGSAAALIATVSTVLLVGVWTFLITETGKQQFPQLVGIIHPFWVGVIPHIFLIVFGYALSYCLPRRDGRPLDDLTIWTKRSTTK